MSGSTNGVVLPPWVRESHKAWSLYDMLHFSAAMFLAIFNDLARLAARLPAVTRAVKPSTKQRQYLRALTVDLKQLAKECTDMGISQPVVYQILKLASDHPVHTNEDCSATLTRLGIIRESIIGELASYKFYAISPSLAYLTENEPLFGGVVADKFPDASKDIAASGRCLALDEWTACVFHCMRALEQGLRALAAYVGVDMSIALELENWKNVIDRIEKEIRKLEDLPRGNLKTEKIRVCSEAASQFRYFKDAWRNHVAHSRESYDSRNALAVWEHTRDFMRTLAENIEAG